MAGAELWLLVRWEREGKPYSFLVRSVRTGRWREFSSEAVANAEVVHENKLDGDEFKASRRALVLDAEPVRGEVPPSGERLYQVTLADGVSMFFGIDADGELATSISLDPAVVRAVLSGMQSPRREPGKP